MSFITKALFGSPPPPPDYAAAAREQGQQNLIAAEKNAELNRLNEFTPYGSVRYDRGGDDWTRTVSLSPEQQQLYNYETGNQIASQQVAQGLQNRLAESVSQPFNFRHLGGNDLMYGNLPQFESHGAGVVHSGVNPNAAQLAQYTGGVADGQLVDQGGGLGRLDQGAALGRVGTGAPLGSVDLGNPLTRMGGGVDPMSVAGPQARDLGTAGNYAGGVDRVADALYRRQLRLRQPDMDRSRDQLDLRLRNQGLMPGTELYNSELARLRQGQGQELNDLADRAILAGGAEQSRLAGLDMGLDAQRFGQQSAAGGFRLGQIGQAFNQDLSRTQQNNAAAQTEYQNRVQGTGFNNAARQAEFDNSLRGVGFNNAAAQTEFGNRALALNTNNAASQSEFDNRVRSAGFNNAARTQDLQSRLAAIGFNNNATTQTQQNQLAATGFNNNVGQTEFQNRIAGAELRNRNAMQLYDAQLRSAGFNNTARANAIQEAVMLRNQPLAEFNAFRTGNTPTMPQFQPYGMVNAAAPDLYGATRDQYGAAIGQYNLKSGQTQSLFNLGAKLAGMP